MADREFNPIRLTAPIKDRMKKELEGQETFEGRMWAEGRIIQFRDRVKKVKKENGLDDEGAWKEAAKQMGYKGPASERLRYLNYIDFITRENERIWDATRRKKKRDEDNAKKISVPYEEYLMTLPPSINYGDEIEWVSCHPVMSRNQHHYSDGEKTTVVPLTVDDIKSCPSRRAAGILAGFKDRHEDFFKKQHELLSKRMSETSIDEEEAEIFLAQEKASLKEITTFIKAIEEESRVQ